MRQRVRALMTKLGGFGIASLLRGWMNTLDFKVCHYDPTVDPGRPEFSGPVICLFWHEYISFPVTIWGHCDLAALVSQHRDGDWISRAANHLGFDIVRGSTTRGGSSALRELKRLARGRNLTIMPDGPQGPRREMAMGPIYLASRLKVPIVLGGFAYERPWRVNSWDRFALPKPFSRARAIISPRLNVPPRLGREELEQYASDVQHLLTDLTSEAEAWADSGRRMQGQCTLERHFDRQRLRHREVRSASLSSSNALPQKRRRSRAA